MESAAAPVGQGLQALVGVGVPHPDDLVVVDLTVPSGDAGERVEVLRRHRDPRRPPDPGPLGGGGAADVPGDVVPDDRGVRAALDQRAVQAGGLGLGDQALYCWRIGTVASAPIGSSSRGFWNTEASSTQQGFGAEPVGRGSGMSPGGRRSVALT